MSSFLHRRDRAGTRASTRPASSMMFALLEPVTRAAVQAIITDAKNPWDRLHGLRKPTGARPGSSCSSTRGADQAAHGRGAPLRACVRHRQVPSMARLRGRVIFSLLGTLAQAHGLIWGGDWGAPGVHHSFHRTAITCSAARSPIR